MYIIEIVDQNSLIPAEDILSSHTIIRDTTWHCSDIDSYEWYPGIWIIEEYSLSEHKKLPSKTKIKALSTISEIDTFIRSTYCKHCYVIIRPFNNPKEKYEYYPTNRTLVHYPCSGEWKVVSS